MCVIVNKCNILLIICYYYGGILMQAMMVEADLNGDGLVDHDEFIKIMLQTNLF